LKKGVKAWTFISVIVYLAFAYYLGSLQADTFPTWKTVLFAVWALLLLLGYLFSFRRGKVQKI